MERGRDAVCQTDISTPSYECKTSEVQHLEMLIHNVSHMDLVFSLGNPSNSLKNNASLTRDEFETEHKVEYNSGNSTICNYEEHTDILCRPHFSAFHMFAKRILLTLQKFCDEHEICSLSSAIMHYPRYERSDCPPRFPLVAPPPSRQKMVPVGFDVSQILAKDGVIEGDEKNNNVSIDGLSLDDDDIKSLRVRGTDTNKFESLLKKIELIDDINGKGKHAGKIHIKTVLFPLLSSLMRQWHLQLFEKYGPTSAKGLKKVLILVSGEGTPRNVSHPKSGNSTEACAELMEIFIKVLYPDIAIKRLHSEREIFKYEENINFVKKEFMPCVDMYRDAHARGERYPDDYTENSDRNSNSSSPKHASNNTFNPDWQQTFSVTLSFADGAPARTHAIQTSLRPYKPCTMHFYELKTFWHETKICDSDVVPLSFEDMETVPPVGVERTSPSIQMVVKEMKLFREHFLKSLNEGRNDINIFWLRKTMKPVLAVLLVDLPEGLVCYRGVNMEVSMPTGSLCAERNVIGTALALNPGLLREQLKMVAVLSVSLQKDGPYRSDLNVCVPVNTKIEQADEVGDCLFSENVGKLSSPKECAFDKRHRSSSSPDLSIYSAATQTPSNSTGNKNVRKIKLHNSMANIFQNERKKTVFVEEQDLNPLAPCGACNEWLKKIAESNPYFSVITFTDTYCNGVYVNKPS